MAKGKVNVAINIQIQVYRTLLLAFLYNIKLILEENERFVHVCKPEVTGSVGIPQILCYKIYFHLPNHAVKSIIRKNLK